MKTELKTIFKDKQVYLSAIMFVAWVCIAALADGGFAAAPAACAIAAVAFAAMCVGVTRFVALGDGLFNKNAVTFMLSVGLAFYPLGQAFGAATVGSESKLLLALAIIAIAACVAVLVVMLLKCLILDFFQPLALDTVTVIVLIVGGVFTIAAAVAAAIYGCHGLALGLCAGMLVTAAMSVIWAKNQPMGEFEGIEGEPLDIFRNGEGGYSTFRIPSLIALDKDVLNAKCGLNLSGDVLLALAEGRKNSSHDTGVVDMLGKLSADGGDTWTPLAVMFTYGEEVGKFGNPTVALDRATGEICMAMLAAAKKDNFDYNTYFVKGRLTAKLTIEWGELRDISLEKEQGAKGGQDGVRKHTLMVGPGKGVQLRGEHDGRIVIPASNGGNSYVIFSDDGGETWNRGDAAGSGNECEAAQLDDGTLVLVVRDGKGCTMPHPEQYQKLSFSTDGGETWARKEVATPLKTPICMASLASVGGKLAITYPDSFHTRVKLTLGESEDGGATWTTRLLYRGASGYSCLTADGDGRMYVLAEVGRVNYNEKLVFLKLAR